ncbi:MAG: methyltransferase domain-containing protein [Spirochaetia bacterium]|nr:methyltransferase domain-containing protein [Spirochaetia bacterium]
MVRHVSQTTPKDILSALKAASDESRLRILHILTYGALNVNEITSVLGMGQSRVSRHLKILADARLLESQREGSWVYYKLVEDSPSQNFSSGLLSTLSGFASSHPFFEKDKKNTEKVLSDRNKMSSKFFDSIGLQWEKVQQEVMNPRSYREKILSYLPDKLNTILDLGCGPGVLLSDMAPRATKVIGVDTSHKMIEEARITHQKNKKISFLEARLEELPIKNNSADAVVASMVLHHVSNPPLVLQEASRILKEKGILCLVDLKKHNQEYMRDNYADLWLGFQPELLAEWLLHSGFEILSHEELQTDSVFKILTIKAVKKGGHHVRT